MTYSTSQLALALATTFSTLSLQIFGFLVLMCSILAIGNYFWETNKGSHFTEFLPRQNGIDASLSAFLTFWSYVIILITVVPISLYVRCCMNCETLREVGSAVNISLLLICRQCGGHQAGKQLLHRLGQSHVLRTEGHARRGPHHHAERGAGPDQVHLQRQNRDAHPEHHDLQQVFHKWSILR